MTESVAAFSRRPWWKFWGNPVDPPPPVVVPGPGPLCLELLKAIREQAWEDSGTRLTWGAFTIYPQELWFFYDTGELTFRASEVRHLAVALRDRAAFRAREEQCRREGENARAAAAALRALRGESE